MNAPVLTRRRERKSGGRRPGRSPEGMEPEPKPASAGCKPAEHQIKFFRRGGRAVECTGLENRQGFAPFVGSNPTPTAIIACK